MFCCTLLYVHSSIAIILMGKRDLVTLLKLSSWRLLMVEWLFLVVPWGNLRFVIVVFPDHTHYFGQPFCSVERNYLCNTDRGHYRQLSCEIILRLVQWFSRCRLKKKNYE